MEEFTLWGLEKLLAYPAVAVYLMPLLAAIGTLYVLGSIVVKLTPTKTDDEWLAALNSKAGWLLKFAARFSYVNPRPPR